MTIARINGVDLDHESDGGGFPLLFTCTERFPARGSNSSPAPGIDPI